ncbi:MAG: hypothetical protein ABGY29_18390, partial [bacterium]
KGKPILRASASAVRGTNCIRPRASACATTFLVPRLFDLPLGTLCRYSSDLGLAMIAVVVAGVP